MAIYRKMGVASRRAAVDEALHLGLIESAVPIDGG